MIDGGNGTGKSRLRAGGLGLTLLAKSVNAHILEELGDERLLSLIELRQAIGSPPQTTIRSHLRVLENLGLLQRHRREGFPGSIDYGLADPGRGLLGVADVVRDWLAAAPADPLRLGTVPARGAITALVEGWSATIVRALAARPLSQTELNRFIPALNYPSLARRVSAMRLAGLLQTRPDGSRGTPYGVTNWLRGSTVPLLASARWERHQVPGRARALDRLDIEAIFLLAVPLAAIPGELSGSCRLEVVLNADKAAGVVLRVERGRVTSCVSRLKDSAAGVATGTVDAWTRVLVDGELDAVELDGDREVAAALVRGLRAAPAVAHQVP